MPQNVFIPTTRRSRLESQGAPSTWRRFKRSGPLLLFLGLAAMTLSCVGDSNVAQASRDLAKKNVQSLPPRATGPSPGVPVNAQRVYLDASLSMKGFANVPGDTPFSALVEGIGDDIPGCQVYKYGQMGHQPESDSAALIREIRFGRELRQPQFYDLDYNPDDRLFARIAEEDPPAFSVLITDGVYSVPLGATSPPVVEALQKWIDRGYAFGVFVFKSPFNGTIYAEHGPARLPDISVPERPFYAFVLSPNIGELRNLRDKLQRRIPGMLPIIFSEDAVDLRVNFQELTKGTYSFKRPPSEPYHWHMFSADLFESGSRATVGYTLSYQVAPEYPVAEFKADLMVDYYRWNGSQFVKVKEGPVQGFDYKFDGITMPVAQREGAGGQPGPGGKRPAAPPPNLTIFYPQDSGGRYGFYDIKFLVLPKSLRPEIQELSTRDDSDPANAGKTFRFYELLNAISEIHFKKRLAAKTSPPLFVTISNY